MNHREIGEIRRRSRKDRSNMGTVYGCYVNSQKEIISSFQQSMAIMPENEAEKYFGIFRRTLSGTIGKNLIDICFRTEQVANGPEHKFLMELKNGGLSDEELRLRLYKTIIDSVSFDENFLILVGCDRYDVPFKSKDGETQAEASSEVYTYIQCAVCPVKQTKANLRYIAEEKEFHDGGMAQVVSAPELGFLFPSFDNRATNIYNALFYTHSSKQNCETVIDALFSVTAPIPAADQKKSFEALLTTTLDEECSLEVVQSIHDEICQSIELHKVSREVEPLLISKEQVKSTLAQNGVSESKIAKFSIDFDETFGMDTQLYPKNIIDNKKIEITTPDVVIKVNPERSDLIETRIIDGVKYILICADENVEVNGVSIHIKGDT